MQMELDEMALVTCLVCSTMFAGDQLTLCPHCGSPGRIKDRPLPCQLPILFGWPDQKRRPPDRALPQRVQTEGAFRWSAWVREPGGMWFLLGRYWTRRGARRAAQWFAENAPMTSTEREWPPFEERA